jgi:hypothetical protein
MYLPTLPACATCPFGLILEGAYTKQTVVGGNLLGATLAACRGAAEAAGIDHPKLVYPYLEKENESAGAVANLETEVPKRQQNTRHHASHVEGGYSWKEC